MLFAIAYLLFPLIGFVNRFDFHPVVFSIPLFLLAYDLLEIDHPLWATFFIFLALTLREDVGFTVFAFGLYVLFFMKQRALGLTWAIVGLTWSLTAIFIVIPYFRGGASDTMGRYAWLGRTPSTCCGPFSRGQASILKHLLVPYRRQLLLRLLLPLGFLSLAFPGSTARWTAGPGLQHALRNTQPEQHLFPISGPGRPLHLHRRHPGSRARSALACTQSRTLDSDGLDWARPSAGLDLGQSLHKNHRRPLIFLSTDCSRSPVKMPLLKPRQLLPPDAPVATMMAYAPHLSLRPELHLFYDRLKLQERPFGFPQTEYLLLNLSDLRWGVNARFFYSAIETAIGQFGYEALYANEDVVLLHQTDEPQPLTGAVLGRVIELLDSGGKYAPAAPETIAWMGRQWVGSQLPPTVSRQTTQFENGISLLGHEAPAVREPGQPLCVTLYWQADSAVADDYTVFLHLAAPDGFVQAQRDTSPVFGFYPTSSWQPGEIVADMHCLQLPPGLAPGQYDILTGLYHPENGERLQIVTAGGRKDNALLLGNVTLAGKTK